MIVFNFLFVILLLIPLAVFMFFIIRKLISEYNKSIRKVSKDRSKNSRQVPNYPEHDVYKRRIEQRNLNKFKE